MDTTFTAKHVAGALLISILAITGSQSFAQEDLGAPENHAPRDSAPGGPGRRAHHDPGEGPVPHRDWHRGDRLPADYRDNSHVVDDWGNDGLQPPPPGYHWVSVNGDYVLVAIATGVIANILLSPRR